MTALDDRRSVFWLEVGLLCLLGLYLCLHTMPRAWSSLNTDFPNYYVSARIAHEGNDPARMYEWPWLEREKDHRAVGVRVIGLLPITPFSTLVMWPVTELPPLTAKHLWLLLNLALLLPLCWLLRSMTGLPYRRIALVFALSFPLHRNLLYGQYYLLLLLLVVTACWAYLRNWHLLAGALVAIAASCKIFPILLFAFFLQRRNWRALIAGTITGLATIAVSIAAFGWNVHRTYLHEILPWTLRGEGLPPYATASASLSSILHYLLLAEPQWNPHPWHSSVLWYAMLQPTLPMLALAPAILLIHRRDRTKNRILLEWSTLLIAALAISTSPASYNFVLLALPMCVLASRLLKHRRYGWFAVLLVVYLGIGFPMPSPVREMGPAVLLYTPRLPLMLVLLCGCYLLLWHGCLEDLSSDWTHAASWDWTNADSWDWTHTAWTAVIAIAIVLNVRSTFHQQRAAREEFAYRLPVQSAAFLKTNAQSAGETLRYIAFTQDGYHLVTQNRSEASVNPSNSDDLSFTRSAGHTWVERGLSPRSVVADTSDPTRIILDDARDPMLSADGESMAYVRDQRGRGQLMLRRSFATDTATESALTPSTLNIYEASFFSATQYAFSAVDQGHPPQVYLTDATHVNAPLSLGETRYPALSPDGRWMAYSRLAHGAWNLWIRNQDTGATWRVADVPCNQIQPAWEADSKTLLYGSDCGRSLWFTALSRRRVIP